MKIFVTGATGFIGGRVAVKLRERNDDVVALVRDPAKASALEAVGCTLVVGDLADRATIAGGMGDCDAVIHGAAIYEIGVPRERCAQMYEANVRGTERVLRAALGAGIGRVVYVSTVNAFGNTEGRVVDETHVHHERYVSCYDETKHLAHKAARRLIDEGLPGVIVQPGLVYGPGDRSETGKLMARFLAGKLPAMVFGELGVNAVYVDDAADGILAALDRGGVGEQYVLGGEITTMRKLIATLAVVAGRKPPRFDVPTFLLKVSAPLRPVIGPMMGFPRNLHEAIRASHNVTYWARHDKAVEELGYSPRPLEQGLRDKLKAEGRL